MGGKSSKDIYIDKSMVLETIESLGGAENNILCAVTLQTLETVRYMKCYSYWLFEDILMVYNENLRPRTLANIALPCALAIVAYEKYHLDPKTLTDIIFNVMQLPWIIQYGKV